MCGGTVSREDDAWWSEKAHICFSLFFQEEKTFRRRQLKTRSRSRLASAIL